MQRIGCRLAIRAEGRFVNAYFASDKSMEGAILLASVKHTLVEENKELFDRWKTLMQDIFGAVVKDVTGLTPVFEEEPAPEHERGGNA